MFNQVVTPHLHNHLHIAFWLGRRFEQPAQYFPLQLSLPIFSHSQYVVLDTIEIEKIAKEEKSKFWVADGGRYTDLLKSSEENTIFLFFFFVFFYLRQRVFSVS